MTKNSRRSLLIVSFHILGHRQNIYQKESQLRGTRKDAQIIFCSKASCTPRCKNNMATWKVKTIFVILKHYTDHQHSQELAKFLKGCQVKQDLALRASVHEVIFLFLGNYSIKNNYLNTSILLIKISHPLMPKLCCKHDIMNKDILLRAVHMRFLLLFDLLSYICIEVWSLTCLWNSQKALSF